VAGQGWGIVWRPPFTINNRSAPWQSLFDCSSNDAPALFTTVLAEAVSFPETAPDFAVRRLGPERRPERGLASLGSLGVVGGQDLAYIAPLRLQLTAS